MMYANTITSSDEKTAVMLTELRTLTSGELYYHGIDYNKNCRQIHKDISEEFWDFLKLDSHTSVQKHSLQDFEQIGEQLCLQLSSKLQRNIFGISNSIATYKEKIISKVSIENTLQNMKLSNCQELFDANIMQLVLDYYSILKSELDVTRQQLDTERLDQQVLIRQAAVLRDIRLFACHLLVETQGTIGLSLLSSDSQQFTRCVKAVTDNVNGSVFGDNNITEILKNTLRVQNVFKLQNSYLSGKLKTASEKVANGKVKGLFCCLTVEQFYKFAAFGLYSESEHVSDLSQIASTQFSTAWFCSKAPLGVPITKEIAHISRVSGTALRLSTARLTGNSNLRFSRYSTMSSLRHFKADQLEQGVFLALCRVLIVHQQTIATAITAADIETARSQNYDALYSSYNEEYVLLQPSFVLPEFFMHVQFPDVFNKTDKRHNSGTAHSSATVKEEAVSKSTAPIHPMLYNSHNSSTVDNQQVHKLDMRISSLDILNRFNCIEEVMLRNQLNARWTQLGYTVNREDLSSNNNDCSSSSDRYESSQQLSPLRPSQMSSANSPRSNLMKKQQIVMQLQELIETFQTRSIELTRLHADKIISLVN